MYTLYETKRSLTVMQNYVSNSPISRIPPEILRIVFEFFAAQSPNNPSVLCAVNGLWRRMAMRTPRLWTNIRITLGEYSSICWKERTIVWLARSRACALAVEIEVMGNREAVHSAAGMLPELLIPQMRRVASLKVRAKYEATLCILCSALFARTVPTRPCSVKTLELIVASPPPSASAGSVDSIVLKTVGITCPRVPNLKLNNLHFPPTWLDASALDSLEIMQPLRSVPIHIADITLVVERSPHLRSLSIKAQIVEPPASTVSMEVANSPILESLTVETNNIYGVIQSLRFPTLQHLRLVDLG
ncbi:hypothetical protein BD410DRAFT_840624 [Rickenella mellea]|uniref:F-box domain-containing protein n=1 Tax=Rickenella mellea TaxID=50990 RepID=A0A4Y7Q2C0_9AGAM|nr:hypothetical protein BD410DRAFT_840624 [Rickenella mellea]